MSLKKPQHEDHVRTKIQSAETGIKQLKRLESRQKSRCNLSRPRNNAEKDKRVNNLHVNIILLFNQEFLFQLRLRLPNECRFPTQEITTTELKKTAAESD